MFWFWSSSSYNLDPGRALTDFGIAAVTFGAGAKLGLNSDADAVALNRTYGSLPDYGEPTLDRFQPGSIVYAAYRQTANLIKAGQASYEAGTQIVGNLADFFFFGSVF